MTRLRFALVLMVGGCGRKRPMPDVFAETIAGWHRTAVREGLDATGPVRNAESSRAATYEGAGKLDARIYALPSAASALDVAQRWTPSADSVFFYSDRFFVVVRWETADRRALQAFVSELQKRIQTK